MTHDEEESRGDADASRLSPRPADEEGDSDDFFARLRTAETGALAFVREAFVSVSIVVAIGLLLYLVSGVWPPMVAVESGSMEPQMERGDLVVISAPDRFSPAYDFEQTGVVTAEIGEERGYRTFGGHGSVVVYDPPSRFGSPIIHRAHFWVEEGENWYDQANPEYVNAESCAELDNCPAPHAGFITKGDANAHYDQASGIAEPVKREWVEGVARLRIPYLGYVRLKLAGLFVSVPVGDLPSVGDSTAGDPAALQFESGGEDAGEKRVDVTEKSVDAAEATTMTTATTATVPTTAVPTTAATTFDAQFAGA